MPWGGDVVPLKCPSILSLQQRGPPGGTLGGYPQGLSHLRNLSFRPRHLPAITVGEPLALPRPASSPVQRTVTRISDLPGTLPSVQ